MDRITAIGEILFDVYPGARKMGGAPLNFLYHIHKFTGSGNIISRIGNDELGVEVLQFLEKRNISTQFIQIDPAHPTGTAIIKLNKENEPTFTIESDRAYDFIETADVIVNLIESNTDCLYFGSLAQRNDVTRNTIRSLMQKNIKYFCDLNIRQNFFNEDIIIDSLTSAHVLKVNVDELRLLNELLFKEKFDPEKTSIRLMKKYKIKLLAITKGSEGSLLLKEDTIDEFKSEPMDAIDTVGAGDAFASVLCLGFLKGWELPFINKIANLFAREICLIEGALPADDKIYKKIIEEF
jgi:fructokinase